MLTGLSVATLLPLLVVTPLRTAYINELAIKRARLIRPQLVLLGDSLTAMGTPWGPRIGYDPLAAISIATGGNVLGQIASGTEWVERLNPHYVHILAGTNDVLLGARDPEPFVRAYAAMIDDLQRHKLHVIVTLIPPTSNRETNKRIAAFNERLRPVLAAHSITPIDLSPKLARNGVIGPEYTIDGVHLNAAGYRIWQHEIAARSAGR